MITPPDRGVLPVTSWLSLSRIFTDLLFCEVRVLNVQDDRVGVTMSKPAVRLEPRKKLGVFCKALLCRDCLEVFRVLAGLGSDVVDVCLVRHGFRLTHLGR